MRKILARVLISFLAISSLAKQSPASEVATIYTSYFSHVVTEDPEKRGIAYDIVDQIFKTAGLKYELNILPWARAQHMTKQTPEALIFPLSWTKTRSENYIWKVNIFNNQTHFISFNKENLSVEEARERLIGVQLKSSWDNWLTEQGFKNIYRVPGDGSELLKQLNQNRIDAWYTDTIIAGSVLGEINNPDITYSDPVQIFKTYLATNAKAPYPHLDKLAEALEVLKSSGKLDEIFAKYDIPPNY